MGKIIKIVGYVLAGVALLCVPLYWITDIPAIGAAGYGAMLIANILILSNAICAVRKTAKSSEDSQAK